MSDPQPEPDPTRAFLLELVGVPSLPDRELQDRARFVDWDRLLGIAGGSLHPIIAHQLDARHLVVPAAVRHAVNGARRANAAMVALRRAQYRPVFQALDRAGVAVTVLKGYALAYQVYPSPETRVMSDLDLWIDEPTPDRAVAAMEPLGWSIPWWRTMTRTVTARHAALRLGESALIIELHCRRSDTIPDAINDFWPRRVPVDLGGLRTYALPTEEMLVHLALHLAEQHHFLEALPRLLDLTLVTRAAPADFSWLAFADRCVRLGVAGWVATSLATASIMLRAPVPAAALDAFRVADLDRLCAMATEQTWLSARSTEHPQSLLAATTPGERASLLVRRLRDLVIGQDEGASKPSERATRMLRRLRYAVRFTVPAMARTLWRGTFRGPSGARLRQQSSNNRLLMEAMARVSAVGSPRGRSPD